MSCGEPRSDPTDSHQSEPIERPALAQGCDDVTRPASARDRDGRRRILQLGLGQHLCQRVPSVVHHDEDSLRAS
jgi:hypothetical protein